MRHVLPSKLHDRVHGVMSETFALRRVCTWYETDSESIVLQGGVGAGKTLGAAWIFEFALHRSVMTPTGQRRGPVWCDAPGLAALAPWSDRWQEYDAASLIVIDDVGTEGTIGDAVPRITAAIERAFNVSSGRIVITTNLDRAAFGERYGSRIASRLDGTDAWKASPDPDYRGAAPSGMRWTSPRSPSRREREAAKREEEERQREEAEFERTAAERLRWAETAKADLAAKLADVDPRRSEAHDEERREVLRRQLAGFNRSGEQS